MWFFGLSWAIAKIRASDVDKRWLVPLLCWFALRCSTVLALCSWAHIFVSCKHHCSLCGFWLRLAVVEMLGMAPDRIDSGVRLFFKVQSGCRGRPLLYQEYREEEEASFTKNTNNTNQEYFTKNTHNAAARTTTNLLSSLWFHLRQTLLGRYKRASERPETKFGQVGKCRTW